MRLADLIRKKSFRDAATATPATTATFPPDSGQSVATVASVAVASRGNEKSEGLLGILEALTVGGSIDACEAFNALSPADRDAWQGGKVSADHLQAHVSALQTAAMRREGISPPHYTHAAHCARCGPVWLWEAANVLACPWCANRQVGLPIPRPEPVACRDCHHFTPDSINPPGGLGRCELRHDSTWPGGDCPKFEARGLEV